MKCNLHCVREEKRECELWMERKIRERKAQRQQDPIQNCAFLQIQMLVCWLQFIIQMENFETHQTISTWNDNFLLKLYSSSEYNAISFHLYSQHVKILWLFDLKLEFIWLNIENSMNTEHNNSNGFRFKFIAVLLYNVDKLEIYFDIILTSLCLSFSLSLSIVFHPHFLLLRAFSLSWTNSIELRTLERYK